VPQIRIVVDQDEPCHVGPRLPAAPNVHRAFTPR
jgi:hypothetical protein